MPSNSHFFKPTGFEESFVTEPAVNLGGLPTTHKKTVEDAVRHVDVANDAFGAVSMSLEPGSGKTTVFPFRFAESKVCVILPTGFDALCAFRLASGPANLTTPNVREDNGANVTYMDSYSAGFMCFKYKGGMPFDIVIVDESDSNAGITKTLTEIRFKGCYVIHLSGTPEGRETVYSTGFPVESYSTLPELSETYFDAVDFIKTRASGKRGMVMVPNSKVARQIHHMIKNSRIIDTESTVEELDMIVKQQSSKEELIVADDSCVRGFNLNLDVVFDFQQTGTTGNMRNITKHEHQQRRMRVGRMKQGQYYYSPVVYSDTAFTQWDVFRNNVARAVFGLPLEECSLQLDVARLKELMVSRVEPFVLQRSLPELVSNPEPVPVQQQRRRRSSALSDNAPGWMLWASGYRGTLTRKHVRGSSGSSSGSRAVTSGSGSSSSVGPDNSVSQVGVSSPSTGASTVPSHGGKFLARPAARVVAKQEEAWTPVIDLGEGGCVEWPEALRAAYSKGDKLCMVKPASWVYTGHAASVDYTQRLLNVIRDGPTFSEPEMEIVCRAWNVMVSRMNFAFARGRDAWGDNERVGFILDYFVSYNNMMLT